MQRKGLLAYLILSLSAAAQPPYFSSIQPHVEAQEISINQGSAALWQSLKKLSTRAGLIMVTAHPDDEDGATGNCRLPGLRLTSMTIFVEEDRICLRLKVA